MSTDTSSIAKKVAIGAIICCGSGAALYYLLKRLHTSSANTSSVPATAEVTNATIEELKALGNKLFSERKYHEAIEMFSRAIQKEGEGCEATKAMCFQNRAASKEKANGFTIQDCLDDYAHAIEMNPSYGKAFFRRSILLHKDQKHGEALAEIFCAIYLDPSLEKNASSLMPVLVEELEKEQHEAFNKEHTRGLPKHVRHERVYAWLHKTVVNDPLKHLVFSSNIPGQKLAEAVRLINNFKYDEVAKTAADEMEEDCRLEALLLAARFSAYENKATEVEHYIEAFNTHYDNLIEFEQDKKKHLKSSLHIIKIETASTKEAILQNFYDAIATDLHNVDYYAMAAFRLVNYGEAHEAMKILSTESLDENNNIKLLRLTLSILANTDGNLDAARLHTAIKDLDDFVQSMETPSPYAKSLLAKVYSTFSQAEPAQELMEFVFAAEPEQSIYYFDRSCMSNSGEEAMTYLRKCLDLEPYHAEANLMYASLMVNEFGNRLNLERKDYDETMEYLDRAAATFDGSPDFPVITGVFRLREILKAKLTAAKKLNLLPDA